MLVIRPEQYAQLAAYELQGFKGRLKKHLLATFPLQTSMADEGAVEQFVELAISQARGAGIETEATVQSFADHMLLLGSDFHRNPLYTDIAAPLFDTDLISPLQRLDLVYERAWSYLDATRGPDAAALIRAMARLRAWMAMPNEPWSVAPADLVQTLARIFPEKCRAHDAQALARFCGAALERARADGFEQPPAQVLYVCVAFLTGLGFFRDPVVRGGALQYAQALEAESDQTHRTKILGRGVASYLDAMLEAARAASAVTGE